MLLPAGSFGKRCPHAPSQEEKARIVEVSSPQSIRQKRTAPDWWGSLHSFQVRRPSYFAYFGQAAGACRHRARFGAGTGGYLSFGGCTWSRISTAARSWVRPSTCLRF